MLYALSVSMLPHRLRWGCVLGIVAVFLSIGASAAVVADGLDATSFFLLQYPAPASISPDGKLALCKTRHEHDFELLVVDLTSHRTIASYRSAYAQLAVSWKPDSKQIAFLSIASDNQNFQLYVWNLAADHVASIDAPLTQVASFRLRWMPGASVLAYYAGNSVAGTIVALDLADMKHPVIAHTGNSLPTAEFAWSQDGTYLAYVPADSLGIIRIMQWANGFTVFKTLSIGKTGAKTGSTISELAWSADNHKIAAIILDPQDEYTNLHIINVATAKTAFVVSQPADLGRPLWIGASDNIVFEVNRKGLFELWMVDATSGKNHQVAQKQGSHHLLTLTADGKRLYDYWYQLGKPPSINEIDPVHDSITLIADSPALSEAGIVPHIMTLKAQDGNPVPVYVWQPPHGNKAALIWVPGGPDLQAFPVWDARIQWLVHQGITVALVNYRGASGYGASFRKQVAVEDEALDILAVKDYLVQQQGIPARNIILNGYSKGAGVAIKAVSLSPDGFGFLVLASALSSIYQYCPASYHLRGIYGFHGEFDNFTLPSKANKILSSCFSPVHWQVFKEEGHNFHRTATWDTIVTAIAGLANEKQ